MKRSPTNSEGYETIQLMAYMLSNTIRRLLKGGASYGGRAWVELQFNFAILM